MYRLIRAAKYLGVAPWDLQERGAEWTEAALTFERCDSRAQESLAKRK